MNLELKDSLYDETDKKKNTSKIWDDVEIIVDPDLEDESTVDINDYLNKYILQCRICGNMFPSTDILDSDSECPICSSISPNGFIYKGKLLKKKDKESDLTDNEIDAINDLNNERQQDITDNSGSSIFQSGDFEKYRKDDITDNTID